MKKQTIFSLFIINLAAFLLVLMIGVEEPKDDEREESSLMEERQHFYREEITNPAIGEDTTEKAALSSMGVSNFEAVMNGHVMLPDSRIPIEGHQ